MGILMVCHGGRTGVGVDPPRGCRAERRPLEPGSGLLGGLEGPHSISSETTVFLGCVLVGDTHTGLWVSLVEVPAMP